MRSAWIYRNDSWWSVDACGLTEGGGGLQLSARQVGSGEVPALVVVVLHVERTQFGEVNPQRAAAVIDVLTVQSLTDRRTLTVI